MVVPVPVTTGKKPASGKSKAQVRIRGGNITSGLVTDQGQRIGIYGSGGIGKTELCANLKKVGINPLFIDLDQGSLGLDVDRISTDSVESSVLTFDFIRSVLQDNVLLEPYDAIVIDTFTKLEEVIGHHVVQTVRHEKAGRTVRSLEDYGFGKGLMHVFEHALLILQDLDALARKGKHVILICHQCSEKVPSAESDDYLEWQPRLQSPSKTAKLRERVFEWCSHFFRIDHDRMVSDGKAMTGDSRSIHTVRTTTAWAKHRAMASGATFPETIPFSKDSIELWLHMFKEVE